MKRILSVLIAMIMTLSIVPAFADASLAGSGTGDSPYLIGTEAELVAFRNKVNGGETEAWAILTTNISLSGNWSPIGTSSNKYSGVFDGNGYEITNFKGSGNVWGFFAYTDGGEIKNLTISTGTDSETAIGHQSALFVAMASNDTKITRCAGYGDISGWGYIGGITYDGACIVENCYYVGNISGAHMVSAMGNGSVAKNCFIYGTVKATTNCNKISNKQATNCYFLNAEGANTVGYGTKATEEMFKSGEIAYSFNIDNGEDVFGQNLAEDGDAHPVFLKSGNRIVKINGEYVNVADDWEPPSLKGGGTEEDPYRISDKETLELFRDAVNKGETEICGKLTADIDLENEKWTPIGTEKNKYAGIFDGNGYEITNLTGTGTVWGFFSYTDGGEIKNLTIRTVTDSVTDIGHQSALFVGMASGDTKITKCAGYGDISGWGYIGGITYDGACIVENCYYVGNIIGAHNVSGMGMSAVATNCFVYGNIKATTSAFKVANGSGTDSGKNFYLSVEGTNTVGYGTKKSENAFKNGEVAYLLGENFGQLLGKDEHPVFRTEYNAVEAVLNGYANTYAVPAVSKVEFIRADGAVMEMDAVSKYTDKIIVNFTGEMDEMSVNDAVELSGVDFTGELSEDKTAYILNITNGVISRGTYVLKVNSSAMNSLGNCLGNELIIQFIVKDGATAIITSAATDEGTSLESIKNDQPVNLTIKGYNPNKSNLKMTVILMGYKTVNGIKEMTTSIVKPIEISEGSAEEINENVMIMPSGFDDADEVKLFLWGYPVQTRLTPAIIFN